ncbi:MAG: PilZ domain-containing protein [Pseudomonas sp.]
MQRDNPPDVHAGYFQLPDQLALDYQLIEPPSDDQLAMDDTSPLFGLLGELKLLDHESQHLIRQIGERDRVLAACLKSFSKRIDLLGQAVSLQLTTDMGKPVPVILSEAGLTFPSDDSLAVGQWLSLRLLLSEATGLATIAQTADCARNASSGQYSVQVSFHYNSDAQRQSLARYIVQRQAQEIRAAKQNERTST